MFWRWRLRGMLLAMDACRGRRDGTASDSCPGTWWRCRGSVAGLAAIAAQTARLDLGHRADPLFRSPWSMQVVIKCIAYACELRTEPSAKDTRLVTSESRSGFGAGGFDADLWRGNCVRSHNSRVPGGGPLVSLPFVGLILPN